VIGIPIVSPTRKETLARVQQRLAFSPELNKAFRKAFYWNAGLEYAKSLLIHSLPISAQGKVKTPAL